MGSPKLNWDVRLLSIRELIRDDATFGLTSSVGGKILSRVPVSTIEGSLSCPIEIMGTAREPMSKVRFSIGNGMIPLVLCVERVVDTMAPIPNAEKRPLRIPAFEVLRADDGELKGRFSTNGDTETNGVNVGTDWVNLVALEGMVVTGAVRNRHVPGRRAISWSRGRYIPRSTER